MRRLNAAFEKVFPGFEQLREEAGAEMTATEIEPGHVVAVPYYQQDIARPILVDETPFTTKRGRELGYRATFQTLVDGIGFETHVTVPYDELRTQHEYIDLSSTAWMTQAGSGYTQDPNARIFARTLMPQVETGPPASDRVDGLIASVFKVPGILRKSNALPLSYVAQAEQGILAAISEDNPSLNLPEKQQKRGKSRGANLSSAHVPYAMMNGAEIIAMMNMGRAAPDKIELADVPEFLTWLAVTGIGGVAASACLVKDGQFGSLRGTTSLRPDFMAANLTGTMRALASGETGEMISWTPAGMQGSEILYGLDSLSRVDTVLSRLSNTPNIRKKVVQGGTHAALLHPLAHGGEVQRAERHAAEYRMHRGRIALMNHDYIYNVQEPSLIEEAVA